MKHLRLGILLLACCLALAFASAPARSTPATRRIEVPPQLAAEYAKARKTEAQALDRLQQSAPFKDHLIVEQQRQRIAVYIAGEVGCRPSLAKLVELGEGKIVVECDDSQEGKQ